MLFEMLILIVGYYLFAGISIYIYGVIKAFELTDFWCFTIRNGYIAGVCPYPRWLLIWLEWILKWVK
jgi:hypothetical protein